MDAHSQGVMRLQTTNGTNTDDDTHEFTNDDYTTALDGDDSHLKRSSNEVDVKNGVENQAQKGQTDSG